MKLLISRKYQETETLGGMFVVEGPEVKYKCKCIELPDNGNQKNVSCIPEGTYECIKTFNEKRGNHFRVLDVEGRTDILIHKGNYAYSMHGNPDTLGCILPGMGFSDINIDGHLDVFDSTTALKNLYAILPDKFKLVII